MRPSTARRVVLAARPKGEPKAEDFRFEEHALPPLADGEVLLRTIYLSLDPYMRNRMNDAKSYVPPVQIDQVMEGGAVSEVIESRAPHVQPGAIVLSNSGWQEYAVEAAERVRQIDPDLAPVSTYLGVLGMPGLTAYTGLLNIGQPKPGETLVVAAAAGAVGSVVGQIARLKGCRVVGIAGSVVKCGHVVNDLGFDACIDHRSDTFAADLKAACPNGIDIYFENVGGKVFETVLPLMNMFGRIPVCGLIAHYNQTMPARGIDRVPMVLSAILVKRLTMRGFIVSDFASQQPAFERDMTAWLKTGQVKYREHVVDGFDNIVPAFQGLFRGENVGKLLVRLASNRRDRG